MIHCMDVYRGLKHAKIVNMGHDSIQYAGSGKHFKKQQVERLFRLLIIQQVLVEICERNSNGFICGYLQVNLI